MSTSTMTNINITTGSQSYKPFRYGWAFQSYLQQRRMLWIPEEVELSKDLQDWKTKLTPQQKHLVTQIFRFFTQADVDIATGYLDKYIPILKPVEIRMMLTQFAAMECFDPETEVLTENGWVKFPDYADTSVKVAQYDIDTGEISYACPLALIRKNYTGKMHHYVSQNTDLMVTENHDILVARSGGQNFKKVKSNDGVWGRNYNYPIAGVYHSDSYNQLTTLDRLLVAIQADGCIRSLGKNTNDNCRTIDFKLKKERKINRLCSLLDELSITYSNRSDDGGFTIVTFALPENINLLNIKNLGWVDASSLAITARLDLLREISFWDGSSKDNTLYYYSTNKEAIDKVQLLCTLSGVRSSISINHHSGEYIRSIDTHSTKNCYVVCISLNALPVKTYPHRLELDYNGDVHCLTMPKGTLIVRRNNKVAVSGNCLHIHAYSLLIDSLEMPESEYLEFMQYKQMKDKHEYLFKASDHPDADPLSELAYDIAVFSAFGEGVQLFSSFAILLNFPRHNLLEKMGRIVTWSIRDESLHVESMLQVFHCILDEAPHIWTESFKSRIYEACRKMVELEDHFIDLAFEMGDMPDLTANDVKQYVRYIADRRLLQLHLKPNYGVKKNPIPWIEKMINVEEFSNFFETEVTEYSSAALTGSWSDVYDKFINSQQGVEAYLSWCRKQ